MSEAQSKILITGGTGFIGAHFAPELLARDHALVLFDIYPPDPLFPQLDYTFIQGDVRDPEALEAAMQGCDRVIHLAAAHHDFGISPATFESVNVQGARNVCAAMDRHGISDLCFFSTVAVYGDAAEPKSEATPPQPNTPYGITKLAAEEIFRHWTAQKPDRRTLVVRPTVTFGPGNYANMFSLIKQIDKGLYLQVGQGSNLKSLSYVGNIVDATMQLWLERHSTGFEFYNYVCQPDLTSRQIAEHVFHALGKQPPSIQVPYPLARLLAAPFDGVIALTGRNLPVSSARVRKLALDQTKFESDKIRQAGFHQSTTLEQGIRNMVQWYQAVGKHPNDAVIRRRLPPEHPMNYSNHLTPQTLNN